MEVRLTDRVLIPLIVVYFSLLTSSTVLVLSQEYFSTPVVSDYSAAKVERQSGNIYLLRDLSNRSLGSIQPTTFLLKDGSTVFIISLREPLNFPLLYSGRSWIEVRDEGGSLIYSTKSNLYLQVISVFWISTVAVASALALNRLRKKKEVIS